MERAVTGVKKSDTYLSLHIVRQCCAPQGANSAQCLLDGVHLLFIPFIALQCSPLNHPNIVWLLLAGEAAGAPGVLHRALKGRGMRASNWLIL